MRATPIFILWVVLNGLAQGWIGNREHVFINIQMTWADAQNYCRQHYHSLSTITTAEENAVLLTIMNTHAVSSGLLYYSWIGLHQDDSLAIAVSQGWSWVDGDASGYRNWGPAQPNNVMRCAEMQSNGLWTSWGCDTTNTFFCYKQQPKVVLVNEKMSWEEALLHCRREHADLASLLTDRDEAEVDTMARQNNVALVWTSLRFLAGEWLWVSESNQAYQEFTQGSLPSCPDQNHRCGARRSRNGQWENRDCQKKLKFVCFREK